MSERFQEVMLVGENDHDYQFAVGLIGGEWHAFAIGDLKDGSKMIFFFPGSGRTDKETEIRYAGEAAREADFGYGGVVRWFVGEHLRGAQYPGEFRCSNCDSLGCDDTCVMFEEEEFRRAAA